MSSPFARLNILYIVAIDFGSYGLSACICVPGRPDKASVMQNCWANTREANETNKNLTALLLDKTQNNKTVAIGYEAQELYAQAMQRKEEDQYMYFQHFKPYLFSSV